MSGRLRALVKRPGLWVFLALFAVYNINLRQVSTYDTMSTRYLPISLLRSGNLDLDEFDFFYRSGMPVNPLTPSAGPFPGRTPYWVTYERGHFVSTFPVLPALLVTPLYLPALFDSPLGGNTRLLGGMLSKFSASFVTALAMWGLYRLALLRTTRRNALIVALAFGLGTGFWGIASQGLWQVTLSASTMIGALYGLVRAQAEPSRRGWFIAAGVFLALSVGCRPPNLLPALVLALYVLSQHRRQLLWFAIGPAIVGGLLIAYNCYYFGSILGGYATTGVDGGLGLPKLEALLGLLISPSRGLLSWSPFLCFAAPCVVLACKRGGDVLVRHTLVAGASLVLFYSGWEYWHGHRSWGNRHLVDLLPFLALWMSASMTSMASWPRRRLRTGLWGVTLAASVFVQAVGAFFFPCDWDSTPRSAFTHPERLWDPIDNPVCRCASSRPVFPQLLKLMTGDWSRKRF